MDFNRTAIIDHADFHDPLFAVGRPLVFDFVALFRRRNLILPHHDRSPRFFSQPPRAAINNSATTQLRRINLFIPNLSLAR